MKRNFRDFFGPHFWQDNNSTGGSTASVTCHYGGVTALVRQGRDHVKQACYAKQACMLKLGNIRQLQNQIGLSNRLVMSDDELVGRVLEWSFQF